MQSSHPFSLALPLRDNIDLAASLAANGTTADPTGRGDADQRKCGVHVMPQSPRAGKGSAIAELSGEGQFERTTLPCLPRSQPHESAGRSIRWPIGPPAFMRFQPARYLRRRCWEAIRRSCNECVHLVPCAPQCKRSESRLLRGQNEQDCISCHNGGTNVSPMAPYANVFAEYAAPKVGHPFPASTNPHDAAEDVLLNNNRHATCVDCHNAHGSEPVGVFPPAPLMRISQKNIAGISATRWHNRTDTSFEPV